MMLQIEQGPSKSYIPKITKEKDHLKLKAFDSGVLVYFLGLYLYHSVLAPDIKQQVLQKLSIKELQA